MSCGLLSQGATCTAYDPVCHLRSALPAGSLLRHHLHRQLLVVRDRRSSLGTCIAVPAGQDPLNQCTDATAATCGTNGFCDGSGACQKYASGTTCIAQSCSTSTYPPRFDL